MQLRPPIHYTHCDMTLLIMAHAHACAWQEVTLFQDSFFHITSSIDHKVSYVHTLLAITFQSFRRLPLAMEALSTYVRTNPITPQSANCINFVHTYVAIIDIMNYSVFTLQ